MTIKSISYQPGGFDSTNFIEIETGPNVTTTLKAFNLSEGLLAMIEKEALEEITRRRDSESA